MSEVKLLPSGYTLLRLSAECWAQVPPGFSAAEIPDDYIFHPDYGRKRINDLWRAVRAEEPRG